MSFNEEVLPLGHDLYNHLVSEGYVDFETFKPNSLNRNDNFFQFRNHFRAPNTAECHEQTASFAKLYPISYHDHNKVIAILNSKLLFVDDVELVESILMNTTCTGGSKFNYYVQSGVFVASLLSSVVFYRQKMSLHFPIGIAALCSVYSVWQYFENGLQKKENNILTHHISVLQKLCANIHKILRFLKETEILSTGQVSSHNIGAAMYMIPDKTINELDKLPSWKTLPHLRKCLAGALVDVIRVFLHGCNSLRQICPIWLCIESCMFSNKPSLQEMLKKVEDIVCSESFIAIKDLQLLNEIYLILQSEYLRWVAFCLCPFGPQNHDELKKCKVVVYNLTEVTQKTLLDVSSKLETQYNFQNIFSRAYKVSKGLPLENESKELNKIQVDVHGVSLEMLSIILKIKNLEDYLEKCSITTDKDCSILTLKENIAQQLSIVRSDLTLAINGFDFIFNQLVMKKKPVESFVDCLNIIKKTDTKLTHITVNEPSLAVSSSDEVFLAVSDFNEDEPRALVDDWCLGREPNIPKTLLTELSKTLKPIKQDFKERERLALERLGLEDIEVELDSVSGEEDENECQKQRCEVLKSSKIKGSQYIPLRSNSESSDDDGKCVEDPKLILETEAGEADHTLCNINLVPGMNSKLIDEISLCHSDSEASSTEILSNSSLAKIIAKKSQLWRNTTEDCYSDG